MSDRTVTRALRRAALGGVALASLALGGCAGDPSLLVGVQPVAAVNGDYRAGSVDIPVTPLPTLDDVINRAPSKPEDGNEKVDRLRGGAMKEAALSYGMRAGLAWESRNVNKAVMDRSVELAATYDFDRVLIKGPHGSKLLPPIISEADKSWESQDAGKTLRVSDKVYEIIEQTRFAAVAPMWQTYLVRDYKTPEPPPDALLPKDGDERRAWAEAVKEGWELGRAQSQSIFQADLDRLERDFSGMVRYKALLEEGKVSPPVLADASMGTTGSGQDMRVNDRAVRITRDPTLNVGDPKTWQASATTPGPDGASTSPGAVPGAVPTEAVPGTSPARPAVPAARHVPSRAAMDDGADAPARARAPVRTVRHASGDAWHAAARPAPAAPADGGSDTF